MTYRDDRDADQARIAIPVLTPLFVVGWLGGVFAGTRTIFRRAARRRAETLADLFQILVTEIESALSAIAARDERAR